MVECHVSKNINLIGKILGGLIYNLYLCFKIEIDFLPQILIYFNQLNSNFLSNSLKVQKLNEIKNIFQTFTNFHY